MIISSGFEGEWLMDKDIFATMNGFRSASLLQNFIAIAFLVTYSAHSYT